MNGSQKNQNVFFFFRLRLGLRRLRFAYYLMKVGSRSGGINQSQSTFLRFVIGLVLPLLLANSTTQFYISVDLKR